MAQLKDLMVYGDAKFLANAMLDHDPTLNLEAATKHYVDQAVTGTITGSGTNGYLTKWSGSSSITNGPQLGSDATKFLNNTGNWTVPAGTTYSASTGLTLSGTAFSLNTASTSALGGIKVGEGLAINSGNGLLSIDSAGADEGDYFVRGTDGFEWHALPIKLKAYSGSLSGNGWATLQGRSSSGGVLTVAYNNSPATWNSGTYSASLVFGSSDTKGLVDMAYNTPIVTFGGASSNGSTDAAPTWYIKLQGTNGCTYTLPSSTSTLGSVTSVTITQGTGITVSDSGTAITSSGTRTISVTSANVSTMMNLLSEGSSNATRNDYAIVQYAGGGTTTTTYHRRKLANVFAALNSSDITTALGYTPYNATNPNGYTSNAGTVTSVKLIQGTGITVSNSGTAITTSGERTISLNMASASALGGVKVGEGLAINSGNGILSIDSTGADEGDYLRRGPDGYEWGIPSNTTYTFASGKGTTNGFTVTPTGGSATTYSVGTLLANEDKRSIATTPSTYYVANGGLRFLGLKNNSTLGISVTGSGTYSAGWGLSPWGDASGGPAWELAFNSAGIFARQGTSTWGSWEQLAFKSALASYLPLAGGTMTGVLTMKGNQYEDSYSGALNMNNSNIYNSNGIYFADAAEYGSEGLNFWRSATTVDSLWANGGNLYFTPGRTLGQQGTSYTVLHSSNFQNYDYEAYLKWGGQNFVGSYGVADACMIGTLGANRLECIRSSDNSVGIEVTYSRDGGSTWTDYGLTHAQRRTIFTSCSGYTFIIGKRAASDTKSVNDRSRLIIHTGPAGVYTTLNKIAIYVTTNGSGSCWVTIDKCIQEKDTSVEANWVNVVTKQGVSGWSGWNIINFSGITTYGNTASSQYGHLRFTFGADTAGGTSYAGLAVSRIMGFGGVGWATPSNLAAYGHLYTWDYGSSAYFPAHIYTSSNKSYDLGASDKRWRYVYANYFNSDNSAENINSSSYTSTAVVPFFSSDGYLRKTSKANFATWLGAGSVTSVTLTQGTGITVSDSGTAITTSGTRTISLNTASTSAIGGVRVGEGLSITAAGVLAIDSTGADEGEYLRRGPDGFEWGTPVTGSGTNNYLVKWSGTNTVTNGATYDTAASNSTIAQRTANGYLYATYFNNSNAAVNIASYTVRGVNFTSSDGFIRNTSKANFTSWLGLGELAYLSAASGNENKYLVYDGSSEYSWGDVKSLTGWSALSSTTAVNDFMTGNTLKFAEVKSYTTAALDGNDGVLLSVGYPGTTNGYGMQILMDDNNAKTTIYARGRKATNYDTWRKIAHSGNLTLSISSNNLSLKVDGTTVSTVTLPNTCLAEGTKILMANRTEKNVEDVVAGDAILSYDPNTNQLIEAIVVGNYETGVSDDFVNYYFDDGSFVTIFGKHCLYSATEGTARGVDFWEPGWEGINDKGETITYIGSEDVHNAGRKRHFDLHSSNKLYYANGILNAQSLTLDYPQYKSSDLPQSFITALKQDFDSSANLNTFKFDRKVGAKLVPLLKEMKQQRKLMDDNKKLLADTDYIVAKFTEGLINTVEWLKAKADRANWRSLVNKAEEAYATAKARYDTYKQQYAPTNTKRERFNAAVARDNACLEELKAYYRSKNELSK